MKLLNNLTDNLILCLTDSYKLSHKFFAEPNTTKIFSYIEPRVGGEFKEVKFLGLQPFLKNYFLKPITQYMINQAEEFCMEHGEPFNNEGWQYILNIHNGYFPLKIRAVKEGTVVPEGNVLVTVENTDPNCAWLTSYYEPGLLRAVWYSTTVATRAYEIKKLIAKFLEETGSIDTLPFRFIDFSTRGNSSRESCELAGIAHMIGGAFMGTDNIAGILASMKYYNSTQVTGFSIPASEHSSVLPYGEDRENIFISNAIDQFGGLGKMISLVADSYDMKNFIKIIGTELKQKILDNGCTIVVRPDSGSPPDVVLEAVRDLEQYFGSTINNIGNGYKTLNSAVRVIQGDGITINSIHDILFNLKLHGYSADNVTFGCGGYLAQNVSRDGQRFAMKCSYTEVNGKSREVFKHPKTDPTKSSKKGRVTLGKVNNKFVTMTEQEAANTDGFSELLQTVYENGKLLIDLNFEDIRN